MTRFFFQPAEVQNKVLPMNLTLILVYEPTDSFAAALTSNKFPGGPVLVGKKRIVESKFLQAVVINNKISNVCPGGGVSDGGFSDSQSICDSVASTLNLPTADLVFPSSTGIIGWRLPIQAMKDAMPDAARNLQRQSILPAAKGITTTDRYPKIRVASGTVSGTGDKWSIVGIAKGAGMIEPNMATMLCYILTDLNIPRTRLQQLLSDTVKVSFNCITVDGDQSTSDTVLLLSSKKVPLSKAGKGGDASTAAAVTETEKAFAAALNSVCTQLAEDIVRNGEGTQHVVKVRVSGAPSDSIARGVGKSIVNSNLVKCAISGCDPNVGRIVGAIGSYLGTLASGENDANTVIRHWFLLCSFIICLTDCAGNGLTFDLNELSRSMVVTLGGIEIFSEGAFRLNPEKEMMLSDYMLDCQLYPAELSEHDRNYPPHDRLVDVTVTFRAKEDKGEWMTGTATVIGSDLTKEYVEVNADYRS